MSESTLGREDQYHDGYYDPPPQCLGYGPYEGECENDAGFNWSGLCPRCEKLRRADHAKKRRAKEAVFKAAVDYAEALAALRGYSCGQPDYDANTHGNLDVRQKRAHQRLLDKVAALKSGASQVDGGGQW